MMEKRLLDAQDYQLIQQLSIAAKRRIAGLAAGEQRSLRYGGGIEFADYRDYQAGDDIRQIDWSVFLRLRRLLVKLCAQEKELTLMILIDISRSMRFGKPDKLRMAARFAAVLAGIALNDGNRAGIATVGKSFRELIKPQRNRVSLSVIFNALSCLETVVTFDPALCLREFAARYGRKCMVVLISDLLYPQWPQTVRNLASSGCEGYILQLLAPEELEPPYLDEVTLIDQENATEIGVFMDRETASGYRRELAGYLLEVRQTCHRLGLGHTMAATDDSLARVFHEELRKGGLLC